MRQTTAHRARRIRALSVLAAAYVLLSCAGDAAAPPVVKPPVVPPPAVVPGVLVISITGQDVGAVVIDITGPGTPVFELENAANTLFESRSGSRTRVAVFGAQLTGAILRFAVSDVALAAQYTIAIQESAAKSNAVLPAGSVSATLTVR